MLTWNNDTASPGLKANLHPRDVSPDLAIHNHCDIMAFNFDVQETLDRALDLWNSIPQAGQWALAGLGALYIAKPVLSFIQLFLNCFILSGTNVCSCALHPTSSHR